MEIGLIENDRETKEWEKNRRDDLENSGEGEYQIVRVGIAVEGGGRTLKIVGTEEEVEKEVQELFEVLQEVVVEEPLSRQTLKTESATGAESELETEENSTGFSKFPTTTFPSPSGPCLNFFHTSSFSSPAATPIPFVAS